MNTITIPSYTKQNYNYGIDTMNVRKMWNRGVTGKDINIAIIDSGCDINHKDLKNNIVGTYNFTKDDESLLNVTDYLGHGTHITGIIGSQNRRIGVAPVSNLLILKNLNQKGVGSVDSLVNAINYAINWRGDKGSKIDVINLSLGTRKDNQKLREAVREATDKNIVIVAAAGNEGDGQDSTNEINYPGYYPEVFQIGAIDKKIIPAYFTNTNANIDFVAPGENIFSTSPNNQYVILSGTSMATAQITGVVALIKDYYRQKGLEITNTTINDYLKQCSEFIPNYSTKFQGYGLVKL